MASLIPGFEYDIFISYRQKDNKGDRWVSEFVEALKTELESTFKEEISVYFDINPHDGLLETHDVDASLKEKLKCLIFIPIISRTYCDPKSFAWEHEFKTFVEQVSQDLFGLKVKLPSGNVANRVLPIRIHDLDATDIKECESVLGGVLRGIEFIYKESGIDKPLAPEDDEKKNLNNTKYRIQIIKVAHAIKEIILGMKTEPILEVKEKDQPKEPFKKVKEDEGKIDLEKPVKSGKWELLSAVAVAAILIIAAILAYPKIFKKNTLEKLRSSGERISVAVMPFQNMTNDTSKNFWQEMIQNNLITSLSNAEELLVRQTETIITMLPNIYSTNYASITPSVAHDISQKLDANVFIHGSINQIGTIIRLNAKLIDSETEEILKSFQIDGTAENILRITDSLSVTVRDYLIISVLKKEVPPMFKQTIGLAKSPGALRNLIDGQKAFSKRDYREASEMLLKAIEIDSTFATATILLAFSYGNQGLYEDARKWCLKVYDKRDEMTRIDKIFTEWAHAYYFGTPSEVIKYLRQAQEIDDHNPGIYYNIGLIYNNISQYDKAIIELEKSLEILDKWNIKPTWVYNYIALGIAYHETGQYKKERKLYRRAEKDFPDDYALLYRQAVLALSEGKTKDANAYIEKYKSLRKDKSASEAAIATSLGSIYLNAGIPDKAEEYYRQSLALQPENPDRVNNLAWLLIDKELNIEEGVELISKALETRPDDYYMLDTKGWGLYKQGKYTEALDLLVKCWELKPIYDHEVYLHLEAAKKAVAGQK